MSYVIKNNNTDLIKKSIAGENSNYSSEISIQLATMQQDVLNNQNSINDIINEISEIKKTEQNVVSMPDIRYPKKIKYDTIFTLEVNDSKTAFKDNGAVIDYYKWTLPDNSEYIGSKVTYTSPDNVHIGDTIIFKCQASLYTFNSCIMFFYLI